MIFPKIISSSSTITIFSTLAQHIIFLLALIQLFEELYKIAIYITPRFDGFDKAQIDTYFEIYKIGEPGGNDYSSDAHVGDRYESSCRAIQEVCVLIEKEKNNENN